MEREPGGHQDVSRTMRWGESDVDFLGGVGVGLVSEGSLSGFYNLHWLTWRWIPTTVKRMIGCQTGSGFITCAQAHAPFSRGGSLRRPPLNHNNLKPS